MNEALTGYSLVNLKTRGEYELPSRSSIPQLLARLLVALPRRLLAVSRTIPRLFASTAPQESRCATSRLSARIAACADRRSRPCPRAICGLLSLHLLHDLTHASRLCAVSVHCR